MATQWPPGPAHLFGHGGVNVLGLVTGHEVDRGGTDEVPPERGIVLQAIAGTVLQKRTASVEPRHRWLGGALSQGQVSAGIHSGGGRGYTTCQHPTSEGWRKARAACRGRRKTPHPFP